jgi:uroporphyrinogen-III decarboxylase
MSGMSARQRVLAVYRNEVPDRTPVGIYSRYLPRGSLERAVRNLGLAIIDYHPVVSMIGPAWHLAPGYVSEIKGTDFRVDYAWDQGQLVERRTFATPVGTVWEELVQDKGGAGSERIRKHYVADKEDYRVVTYLVENTVVRSNEETLRLKMEDLDGDGIVLGRVDRSPYQKCLIELVGPEKFLVDLHTEPGPALELMDAIDRQLDRSFELIVRSDVEIIWQPDNVTADMTPPRAYREYCLPFYQRHAAQVKEVSKPYAAHMDGRIRALTELVNQSGFDVIESLSLPDIGGDLTLSEARKALPGKVLIPNLPSNWCLREDGELAASVRALLAEAGRERPFMFAVSEDIPVSQWKRVLPIVAQVVADCG